MSSYAPPAHAHVTDAHASRRRSAAVLPSRPTGAELAPRRLGASVRAPTSPGVLRCACTPHTSPPPATGASTALHPMQRRPTFTYTRHRAVSLLGTGVPEPARSRGCVSVPALRPNLRRVRSALIERGSFSGFRERRQEVGWLRHACSQNEEQAFAPGTSVRHARTSPRLQLQGRRCRCRRQSRLTRGRPSAIAVGTRPRPPEWARVKMAPDSTCN